MVETFDVTNQSSVPLARHHRRRSSVAIPLELLRALPPDNQPPVVCHHHRCPSGSMPCNKKCWATLLTRPSYLPGVILLHHSLQKHRSQYPLLVLTTLSLPQMCIAVLDALGIQHRTIEPLYLEQKVHLIASRFEDTWTKLRVFELVEYETIVLLDADMLVRRNMDELFMIKMPGPDWIAASHACVCNITNASWAPDDWVESNCAYTNLTYPSALTKPTPVPSGPPYTVEQPRTHTLLNSGLVVLHPCTHLFGQVSHFLRTSPLVPTLLFPDQDLLGEIFRDKWIPLAWQYNAIKTNRYQHQNSWRDEEVRNVHYIVEKPWMVGRTKDGKDSVCNGWWWDEFGDWRAEVYKELGQEKAEMVVGEVKRWCGEENT
ncbi:nucleotide-diphospho-sugar transferase [Tirmania nivea]|nr:nucleotide-diphospho-sugar transferase [Tirmania nivea]